MNCVSPTIPDEVSKIPFKNGVSISLLLLETPLKTHLGLLSHLCYTIGCSQPYSNQYTEFLSLRRGLKEEMLLKFLNTWPCTLLYFLKSITIYFLNYILERYLSCTTAQSSCEPYPPIFFSMGEIHASYCYGRLAVRHVFFLTWSMGSTLSNQEIFFVYANINHHLHYYFHFGDYVVKPRFSMGS